MPARRRTAIAALALVTGLAALAGCSGPSPAPTVSLPSTSPILSPDDEAFRAAEETYRAYVDALNAVDLSDPATFEPVYALTTGELSSQTRQSLEDMRSNHWTVSGQSVVREVRLVDATRESVEIAVCIDVRDVTVRDADGEIVRSPDRSDLQQLRVRLISLDGHDLRVDAVGQDDSGDSCLF